MCHAGDWNGTLYTSGRMLEKAPETAFSGHFARRPARSRGVKARSASHCLRGRYVTRCSFIDESQTMWHAERGNGHIEGRRRSLSGAEIRARSG